MSSIKDKGEQGQRGLAGRRAYVAPSIEESGRFEHLVLTCAFTVGDGNCEPARGKPPREPKSL